ncbi:MAG: sigma 54-interacting transcriptional regulator [Euryarchaeota archaeon]|nr:sigma 54-interacting transcriptional regulator [Euryarchaeota archaeon]
MSGKIDLTKEIDLRGLSTTDDILIPADPLKRVIGQDEAVELARIAARQRRHLLLVGPPGTGKSMIAQALALHLPHPTEEVRVVHNPENPERPLVEVRDEAEVLEERESKGSAEGELIKPEDAPANVAERLGYRCRNCGIYSPPSERFCPGCEKGKLDLGAQAGNPFGDILGGLMESMAGAAPFPTGKERVTTTRRRFDKEEVVVFERSGNMIRVLEQKALERRREMEKLNPRKVIVPIDRNPFILSTGASETELLGDVRHDPFGGHSNLGTPPFDRVVPGAIHEAHQGVLFLDEISHLGATQRYILTAMQEKQFPIAGRNPQSAGASVRVDNVPSDFILVAACNIQDLEQVLSPLRSRISGDGYEVLVETTMDDSLENRALLAQFVAQEIVFDGRIPHANLGAVEAIIKEARRRAKVMDGRDGALTLRLRELGGLVRSAGDLAVSMSDDVIDEKHVIAAIRRSRPVEEQIKERYGSYMRGLGTDISSAQKEKSPYYFWNEHIQDDQAYH